MELTHAGHSQPTLTCLELKDSESSFYVRCCEGLNRIIEWFAANVITHVCSKGQHGI